MIHRKEPKAPEDIYLEVDDPDAVTGPVGTAYANPSKTTITYTRVYEPYVEVDAIQDEMFA